MKACGSKACPRCGRTISANKQRCLACVNDVETRNRLVEQNMDLVTSTANRVKMTLPPSIEFDDLVQEGAKGLMKAAARFREVHEEGFAAPVRFRDFAGSFVRGAMVDSCRRRHYLNATLAPLEEAPVPSYAPAIDAAIDAQRIDRELRAAALSLPDRQRRIVGMYYDGGLGQREIAKREGVAESSVSEIRRDGLRRMRRSLGMRNFRSAA